MATVIGKKDVDNIKQYNIETEKQNQYFGQNIEQRKILKQQLIQQEADLQRINDKIVEQQSHWGSLIAEKENALEFKKAGDQFVKDWTSSLNAAGEVTDNLTEKIKVCRAKMVELGYSEEEVRNN